MQTATGFDPQEDFAYRSSNRRAEPAERAARTAHAKTTLTLPANTSHAQPASPAGATQETGVFMRSSGRAPDELRSIELIPGFAKHAEGSCLVKFGDTHVLTTASFEERPPFFLRDSGKGWVTAEYGMLPRATGERMGREAARGKQSGRTQEIQRLIGRSLRAVTALETLGERQIRVDCDVLQADGGTRTASITGAYIALRQCLQWMYTEGWVAEKPSIESVSAISCGVVGGQALLDLDYSEDSSADVDANFVISGGGGLVEVQATAEEDPFEEEQFLRMMRLARLGCSAIKAAQEKALADIGIS